VNYPTVDRAGVEQGDEIARLFCRTREFSLPYLPRLHTVEEDRSYFKERVFADCEVCMGREASMIVGFRAYRTGWIDHLYVDPESQGRGVGTTLIRTPMSVQSELRLWVFERNEFAIRFYRSKGFELTQTTDRRTNEERLPDALDACRSATGLDEPS